MPAISLISHLELFIVVIYVFLWNTMLSSKIALQALLSLYTFQKLLKVTSKQLTNPQ